LESTSQSSTIPPAPSRGLLESVARGDADAYRAAVDAFGPLVWSIARTYTPTAHDAEDAAQEAFLKLWRVAHRYDPSRGSEVAFVVTVARNAVLDYRRRTGSSKPAEHRDPAEMAAPSSAVTYPAIARDDARVAQEAMKSLPRDQHEALSLAIHRGLTQEAIARTLNIPLGTVKTRIRSALIGLRQALTPRSPDSSRPTLAGEGQQ
jgi:RNA polymerase sigma-70 factor (ECF subfamily)